jgi:DNA helicase II / ATP-dependent DNA helicase PcrA
MLVLERRTIFVGMTRVISKNSSQNILWNSRIALLFISDKLILEKLQADKPRLAREQTVPSTLLCYVTDAYDCYRKVLVKTNSMDFAHLQKWTHKLLSQPNTLQKITSTIRYVLVDEYQDTNYIQEQILSLLASGTDPKNLIVIGDEDQCPLSVGRLTLLLRPSAVRNLHIVEF